MLPVFSRPSVTIVDCGASRVALGVFRSKGDQLQCTHLSVEPLSALHQADHSWLASTSAALRALNAAGAWSGPVVLVLPPHLLLTKSIRVPRVDSARLKKIIHFEAEQCIPSALSDLVWDHVVTGAGQPELEIMLVAVKRKTLNELGECAQASGFSPRRIIPATLTTLASHHHAPAVQGQSVLRLNVGARSTIVLQIAGKQFLTRTLALGGTSVSRQIGEKKTCGMDEAERIKLTLSDPALVADATEVLAVQLTHEIRQTMMYFERQGHLTKPEQLILTGGSAVLPGLGESLASKLKIPVKCPPSPAPVDFGRGFVTRDAFPSAFTDLLGAAAIELQGKHLAINLLPPGLNRMDRRRKRKPWLWGASALLTVALMLPILHYRRLGRSVATFCDALEAESAPLRARATRMQSSLAQLEALKARASHLHSMQTRRTAWLELFAGLQEHLVRVEDVWLENMQVIPPAPGAPLRLLVSGRMLDRSRPVGKVSPEAFTRLQALLTDLGKLPNVAAVEGERYDHSKPGILTFDFALVADPARPL